jgi:magnesium-transporting ATPase (P-type)
MKKSSLKEITHTDSLALTAIINYWNEWEPNTVLITYAELKRRKFTIDNKLNKQIDDFCKKNNEADIDLLLTAALKEIGYESYQDCYEKEINSKKKEEAEKSNKIEIGSAEIVVPDKKYPALRTISEIYKIFGWVLIIATIIIALVFLKVSGIFAMITIIVGALIVLGVFAVAESIMVFIDIEKNTRNKTQN